MATIFELLELEGYGSFHYPEIFKFRKKGLTIIRGENGKGKTTILSCLLYVLYGKGVKDTIETWEHIRKPDYKGTRTSLKYSNGDKKYKIIRCRDYKGKLEDGYPGGNRLLFFINGVNTPTRDKKDIQREIQESIGVSFDLFKNMLFFGQKMKKLISESGPDKKKILEEAFEMFYISKAKQEAKKEKDEAQAELGKAQYELNSEQDKLQSLEQSLLGTQEAIDEFEDQKNKRIGKKVKEIKELNDELREVSNGLPIEQIELQLETLNTELSELKPKRIPDIVLKDFSYLDDLKEKLNRLNSKKLPKKCPRCLRKFDHEHLEQEELNVALEKRELIAKINEGTLERDKQDEKIRLKDSIKSSNKGIEQAINSFRVKINSLEIELERAKGVEKLKNSINQKISKAKLDLSLLKQDKNPFNLAKIERQIHGQKLSMKSKNKNLRLAKRRFDIASWLNDVALSNGGLKAYILEVAIKKINRRLSYYQKYIGLKPSFVVDMATINKDINIITEVMNGVVPYGDLSGGQQQLVDIAIAFSINDIVYEQLPMNLLILDEIFESLSKNNVDIMGELIMDKAINRAVYLITHKSEFSPLNAEEILITLKDGISSVQRN